MLCSHYIIELFKITKTFFSLFRHLKRYDIIKLVDEISLNFPNLVVIRKYVKKSSLKTRGRHAVFSVLEIKTLKMLQKLNKQTTFVYIIGFIFYGVSGAKTDLYNKYMN